MRMFFRALIEAVDPTFDDPRFGSYKVHDKGGCEGEYLGDQGGGCLREFFDQKGKRCVCLTTNCTVHIETCLVGITYVLLE